MKSLKKMLLGIALLILAAIGAMMWFSGLIVGAVAFFVFLIVGLFLCIDGFLSVDD